MHLGMAECRIPYSGHCDLDLVFRIIMSGAYVLYFFEVEIPIWCADASGMEECGVPFSGHCDRDL